MISSKRDMKASDIHNLFMSSIANKRVKLLESSSQAKTRIKSKDSEKQSEELMPHVLTDILQEEIMNLEYKQSGNNTDVIQISKSTPKDKFSSLEYALWYVHTLERDNKKRKKEIIDTSKLFMFKAPSPY